MNPIRIQKHSVMTATVLLVIAAVMLAACTPAAAAVATATPGNTLAPTATSAQAAPATINLASNATLGSFLVDSKGMTLYLYLKDTPGVSNCSGGCLQNWPALLTSGSPVAGSGVDASKLGTITRSDGSVQVTYNNAPLYYFIKDKAAGDTFGQNVGTIWFVVAPDGSAVTPAPGISSTATAAPIAASTATPAALAVITVSKSSNYDVGSFLVGGNGMTLYTFSNDTPGVSNCNGGCATNWPPLVTTSTPTGGNGVDASKLGTITRADGSKQVTYNNLPLYFYTGDGKPGDTTGQGVNSVWYVAAP